MTRMDTYYRKTRRPIANLSSSLKKPPPQVHTSPHITATTTPDSSKTKQTSNTNSTISASAKFLQNLHEKDGISPPSPPKTPRRRHRALFESPPRPTTPSNARLTRPIQPPPVKRKILPEDLKKKRRPALTVRELFRSAHPLEEEKKDEEEETSKKDDGLRSPQKEKSPIKQQANISSPHKQEPDIITTTITSETTVAESLGLKKLILPATPPATPRKNLDKLERFRQLHKLSPKKQHEQPESPSKITSGPLKGISTSLLDLIRAKEAKAKETPEQLRQRELLGIAPEIARIVPTLFTAHKREVMSYDKIVDKCYKGLRSNYSTVTIMECLDLMNKVAPEWVTIVEISRGKFMRLNKDKYTLPQLLQAIKRYKGEKNC
uniref:DNA replication factor Cdt1 n=1 Tax=Aceria tosichella TaxID=561515 RepID=A0A6G1SEK1_9ACAR